MMSDVRLKEGMEVWWVARNGKRLKGKVFASPSRNAPLVLVAYDGVDADGALVPLLVWRRSKDLMLEDGGGSTGCTSAYQK